MISFNGCFEQQLRTCPTRTGLNHGTSGRNPRRLLPKSGTFPAILDLAGATVAFKLIALVLALALVLASCAVAFADTVNDSITINNAKPGETYNLYKIFDLIVNDRENPTSYSYKINSDWAAFFGTSGAGAAYVTVNSDGYVTEIKNANGQVATDSKDLATVAAAWTGKPATPTGTVTVASNANTAVFSSLADGYYLITSTVGSFAMAETTPSTTAVTINEKNFDDTVEKKVKEDSTDTYGDTNDAQVGDTVDFKTTATIQPRSINVKIHDTMTAGLTFDSGSINIYTDATLTTALDAQYYTIQATPDTNDTFTIQIADSFAASATAAQSLYVTYTAKLNQNAVKKDTNGVAIVDARNKTTVTWGNGSSTTEDFTDTTTHKFSVFKHAANSNTNLAGAVFQVLKGTTVLNLKKLDDTNYRIVDATETGSASSHANNGELNTIAADAIVSDFVTVSTGDIVIWGVDSDGDYHLHEVQAPKGYNLLTTNVDVTVNANNATRPDVTNNSGTELPSTGGIGTTIFYILGGLLVVGAAVVLVARRKAQD